VKRTDAFDSWLKGLADAKGRAKIQARIDRLANGNPVAMLRQSVKA
jgi:putative component of toxin-antitoxin plasmid stabilization module